eukprot:COSAG02_NODE_7684_length_2895_cov_7.093705_3_plen_501_part_00
MLAGIPNYNCIARRCTPHAVSPMQPTPAQGPRPGSRGPPLTAEQPRKQTELLGGFATVLSTMALSEPLTAEQLWYACIHGDLDQVEAHHALRGDLNLRSNDGRWVGVTGLMAAVRKGQQAMVAWLVRAPGIEIDAQDNEGRTALHWAAKFRRAGCVPVLLEAGADARIKNEDGKTALEMALFASYEATEKGEPLAIPDELYEACRRGYFDQVKTYHALGGDFSLRPSREDGMTPLMPAVGNCQSRGSGWEHNGPSPAMLAWLVRAPGIEINAQDNEKGWTALHWAAWANQTGCIVSVLLAAGADARIKDKRGKLAHEVAQDYNHLELVPVLERAAVGLPFSASDEQLERTQRALQAVTMQAATQKAHEALPTRAQWEREAVCRAEQAAKQKGGALTSASAYATNAAQSAAADGQARAEADVATAVQAVVTHFVHATQDLQAVYAECCHGLVATDKELRAELAAKDERLKDLERSMRHVEEEGVPPARQSKGGCCGGRPAR